MFDNLSLKAKILIGNLVTLTFLVVIGLVCFKSIRGLENTNGWVDHTHTVIKEAMEVEAAAVDMETGMRGFLLAGQEEFLEPYNSGNRRFYGLIDELKKTVSDNPAQVTLLGEIEGTISDWKRNVTEKNIELRREIGDSATLIDLGREVGKAKGKKYFDRFRDQIATFIEREEVLLKKRKETLSQSYDINEVRDAGNWVSHTYNVIGKANEILASAVDMETGARGFLLAGKEEFLEPYNAGGRNFDRLVSELKTTVSDNPAQVSLLSEIEVTIDSWKADVIEPNIQLRRDIGNSKTMVDMAAVVGKAEGKQYFDAFREKIKTFRDREDVLMKQRQEAAAEMVSNTIFSLTAVTIIAVIVSLIISWVVSSSIIVPFKNICRGLERFSSAELKKLSSAFNEVVRKMSASANKVSSISNNMMSVSTNLSQISNHQASSVEETSASTEEISGMVRQNVKAAEESKDLSNQMGDKLMSLNDAMGLISESNEKIIDLVKIIAEIGEKTQIIDEIVFQTKLLSFNASVEAERAGEHGRGFAVVAQEVGNLAQMSGKAANDISSIVKQSVNEAETIAKENSKRVEDGTKMVSDTREQSSVVAKAANDIAQGSNEQARGVMEVSKAIESINKTTQHAASIADQASSSSKDLTVQSSDLNKLVQTLNGFLQGHSESESMGFAQAAGAEYASSSALTEVSSTPIASFTPSDQASSLPSFGDEGDQKSDAWNKL